MQAEREDVNEEDRHHERRDRRPHGGEEQASVVDHRVLPECADDAEGQCDGEREDQGLDAELRRDREALPEDLGHRPLPPDAGPEVEVQDVIHVHHELLRHRLIQSVELVPPVDDLLLRRLIGVLVEWRSRCRLRERKSDERDEKKRRNHQ